MRTRFNFRWVIKFGFMTALITDQHAQTNHISRLIQALVF
ncbi:Uncharacterised protein [Vibrio cholerae]|nr:Uncharacterised protein [Vibrio cholerae]